MTGNSDLIDRILAAGLTRHEGGGFRIGSTEGAMADRERSMIESEHACSSMAALCKWQLGAYPTYMTLSIGTNIYGWAVHDFMGSNIRGGRASVSDRGMSLADCIDLALTCIAAGPAGWRSVSLPATLEFGSLKLRGEVEAFAAELNEASLTV